MDKFLITGITGFAGPHLAQLLLKKGHTVDAVIRCPNGRDADLLDLLSVQEHAAIKFHVLDLKDYAGVAKLFKENKFDGVFHLAAQSHPPTGFKQPVMTFADNVTATVNLIDCVGDAKFHFCSTSEVYGDTCDGVNPLKETDKLCPSNPYAASKAAMDLYMQERMTNGFINGFITRAFSHTGPRRGYNFSISSDAYQIAKMIVRRIPGETIDRILKIGNLKTERVVMDVRDCVEAYYSLMMCELNKEVFNICGDIVRPMQYFTDLLIELSNLAGIVQEIEPKFYRDIDIQVQIGDCTKLNDLTGWKPEVDIEDTLKDLLVYWVKKLS